MRKKVAVVIPAYKKELSWFENISLEQILNILGDYDKFFVVPESLKYYYAINGVEEIRLDDSWFRDVRSYNMLIMTTGFYECFAHYEYILICQLDAFVFSDKLEYFCNMGYDYIGAPWIDGEFYYKDSAHVIWHVGNGGLSLRKVDSFLNILKTNEELLVNNRMNEDLFFATLNSEMFHVASESIALEFSFEMKVRECYTKNSNRLPFGCHAWQKFDLPFWKKYIENYGYTIPEEMCREGQEDSNYLVLVRRKEIAYFWTKVYKKENLKTQIRELFGGSDGDYAIWGAGYWGQMLCWLLEDAGMRVAFFIDQNMELENCQVKGHNVIMPKRLEAIMSRQHIIVSVTNGYEDIAEYLDGIECQYGKDYIFLKDINMIYKNVII